MTRGIPQHEVEPDECPHCHHFVDAATGINGPSAPKPGDMTMCWYCGKWSAWQDDGKLGQLTAEQLVYIMTSPACVNVDRKWHERRP